MPERSPKAHAPSASHELIRDLANYREPSLVRSIFEIVITIVPFCAIWALTWFALDQGYWIGLLLVLPGAGLLLRLFIIQHDCGHGSFFRNKETNDWVGRALGVFTLTPYYYWRHSHALHHASSGNLDRRGFGDIDTLTVTEFEQGTAWRRLLYRLYRHPIVLFGIGPSYLFIFRHRLPVGMMRGGWQPWTSVMATNVAIAILVAAVVWLVGAGPFLVVHLPITMIAASVGVWLFYVQHQFEDTSWERNPNWSFAEAALHGSSHYDLPVVLRWFTGNIGVHHVHHLASRIPFYRLPQVLKDRPEIRDIGRLTLWESLKSVRLVLWDEEKRCLVSFRQARQLGRGGAAAGR